MSVIDQLAPHLSYGPSDLPWLAEVPGGWTTRRLKTLFREVDRRSETGSETLLSLRTGLGLVDHHARGGKPIPPENLVGYKQTHPGEIVMNRMRAASGLFAVTPTVGLVSPDYAVLQPTTEINLDYFVKLFQTPQMTSAFRMESKGLGTGESGFLRLYTDRFGMMRVPVPPIDQQNAIVGFVRHAEFLIRKYISAKRRLLALLEEQRRSIVRQAVTRGCDPGVRLKPSGIAWMGDVPEHWAITRIKAEFECLNSQRVPLSSTERGQMTLRAYDYYGASGVIDKVDSYLFDDDLILVAEDGANLVLRNLPLTIVAHGRYWVNNHAHILRPRTGNIQYLAALLEAIDYRPWITGAAQPKLTKDRLLSIRIAVPPRNEQDAIAADIDCDTRLVQRSIGVARREIALLREYLVRVVAEVVTGRLDVAGAAALLALDAGGHALPADADVDVDDELDGSTPDGDLDEMTA